MHLPDGLLTPNIWIPAWLASAAGLSYCFKKTSSALKDRMIPLMGVMSAFIFSAQMLNFPVGAGTSGHLLGGVLAGVLLGPYAAAVVISVVLIVQCLIFQDGGLTALGANILNMSFAGAGGGYVIYAFIRRLIKANKGIPIATFAASWFSIVLASIFCGLELSLSGMLPLQAVLTAMVLVHSLIGITEAVLTCLVISFVLKVRPDLIYKP